LRPAVLVGLGHRVRPNPQFGSNDLERLPLRWGVILMAAIGTGAAAFMAGSTLAAIGVAGMVVTALHKVLA
jgi:hypothetical protein